MVDILATLTPQEYRKVMAHLNRTLGEERVQRGGDAVNDAAVKFVRKIRKEN